MGDGPIVYYHLLKHLLRVGCAPGGGPGALVESSRGCEIRQIGVFAGHFEVLARLVAQLSKGGVLSFCCEASACGMGCTEC
jgi:hypothetical protein